MLWRGQHRGCVVFVVACGALVACSPEEPNEAQAGGADVKRRQYFSKVKEEQVIPSAFLEEGIWVRPGVFEPGEAEEFVLPFMAENEQRFRGKRVLEIGTGSGVISLFAARLGASKVVATDISPVAIECATTNATRMGYQEAIDVRFVPSDDVSAYSTMQPAEKFDIIISNPPYSLDIDAARNTPAVDTGDLGLSIIDGLPERLEPGGIVFLLYNSTFYHYVMVKYAEREGYLVTSQTPSMVTVFEATALFNSYLGKFLEHEGVDDEGLRFDPKKDFFLGRMRCWSKPKPLLPGNSNERYPGMIVIQRK